MKKLLSLALMVVATIALSSCEDKFEVTYNVDINGDADGNVCVTFPDGSLTLNGDADLAFHYGNAPVALGAISLGDALNSDSKDVRLAAEAIQEDIAESFSATSLGGTYYVHVGGYAEAYGVKISIDETFTNRE